MPYCASCFVSVTWDPPIYPFCPKLPMGTMDSGNFQCGREVPLKLWDFTRSCGKTSARCPGESGLIKLRWRHNGRDSVSNHQPHDCLLNHLFRRRSKKTSKLRVTGLCAGNSPGTGEFPAQMASNAENASIWWRHHDKSHDSSRHWWYTNYRQNTRKPCACFMG